MYLSRLYCGVAAAFMLSVLIVPAGAQTPPPPSPSQPAQQEASQPRKPTEYEEAESLPNGAGNSECVWLGRRAVNLLWRDDIDTAQRHINMYERLGCPTSHFKAAFRCLLRQGPMDPKQPETLNAKVHACWINPELQAETPAPDPAPAPKN